MNVFKQIGLLSLEPLSSAPKEWSEVTDLCLCKAGNDVSDRASRLKAISVIVGDSTDAQLAEDVLTTLEE